MTCVRVSDAIESYLHRKSTGSESGTGAYEANAESILRRWSEWLESEHELTSLFALEPAHLEAYARGLSAKTQRGEYVASTARTYYAVVRAFLSWCVRGGILESNPAVAADADAILPSETDQPTDHLWIGHKRRQLEQYVRERALEATNENNRERRRRLREYAIVALFSHSAVRGSELFRTPDDERRTGATWADVDFYTGTIRVLGRSQRYESVSLPAAARTPLRRYRVVLDPPTNEWPLFPTRHAPTIARHVQTTLDERGYDDAEIDSLLESATATQLLREHAITPPAITTEGVRSILKRLCTDAGIDADGTYLTPTGVGHDRDFETQRRSESSPTNTLRVSFLERSIAVPERFRIGGSSPDQSEPTRSVSDRE